MGGCVHLSDHKPRHRTFASVFWMRLRRTRNVFRPGPESWPSGPDQGTSEIHIHRIACSAFGNTSPTYSHLHTVVHTTQHCGRPTYVTCSRNLPRRQASAFSLLYRHTKMRDCYHKPCSRCINVSEQFATLQVRSFCQQRESQRSADL